MPVKTIITFAASAVADIREIQTWYAEQLVPEIGKRFAGEIVAKIEALQSYPEMGRIVPEFGVDSLRELIYPPFRIVRCYDSNRVRIVRIWRSERLLKLP